MPQNNLQTAANLLGMGLKYGSERYSANKANKGTRRVKPSGKRTGSTAITLHSHNITGQMTVVQVVYSFDQIFKETAPGVHKYHPASLSSAVGKLEDYKPLAARAKVRFSFSSDQEVQVTFDGAKRVIRTKQYNSGWLDLHVAMPLNLVVYSKDPVRGEYFIECAGLIDWDSEVQNRITSARQHAFDLKFAEMKLFAEYMASKEEEEDEEEEESHGTRVDKSPPPASQQSPNSSEKRRQRELD
jgi:hypothetical protein